jgi:RND family efflux transporter MFP subunit
MKSITCWSRRGLVLLSMAFIAALVRGRDPSPAAKQEPSPKAALPAAPGIEFPGRTQCTPKGKALIAPVPLHPVEELLVSPGDRVKKGQPLVKIDADEQQAEVRAKKAALENATVALKEAKRYLAAIEKHHDAIPEQKCHEAHAAALKAEGDVRVAKALLESAEAELEHYTIVSPIDGVVNRLDVCVGTVSRPGTVVWGEILDLAEVDVRCEVPPAFAADLSLGQPAEIRSVKDKVLLGVGKVTFVGFSADKTSGLVPVTIRLANANWKVRSEIPVQVAIVQAKEPAAER